MTLTKAKAREQQTTMAVRLRDAEEALKDRVATTNETIADLNRQLEVWDDPNPHQDAASGFTWLC